MTKNILHSLSGIVKKKSTQTINTKTEKNTPSTHTKNKTMSF